MKELVPWRVHLLHILSEHDSTIYGNGSLIFIKCCEEQLERVGRGGGGNS